MSSKFSNKYIELAKKYIPVKTVTIRPNDKPWFNSSIRKSMRLRDRLHKQLKRKYSVSLLGKYRAQRNKVNNMVKYAREQFFINVNDMLDNEGKSNPKSYWSLVKKLMGKSTSSPIPPLQNEVTGEFVVNDEDKANLLNTFFCSISEIIDSDLPTPVFDNRTGRKLDVFNITIDEIKDVLLNLRLGKAVGNDKISHNMLKHTASTVCKPLEIIFNCSLQTGRFPHMWKSAIIIALFKKGIKSDPTNYRPISLLSCVGKVFERVIFKYIYNFLIDNSLIYKYQSGFMHKHSTVHQLIEIYHNICLALENHEIICSVFCDISKAFDRVWHKGLIKKIEGYGITGNLLRWLENYISNRYQRVSIRNCLSEKGNLKGGVPQGSVLGPLLFLLYINDIADNTQSFSRLFADDTSLLYSSNNINEIEVIVNSDLSKIYNWSKEWLIDFNPKKTECIIFSTNQAANKPCIVFNNENVKFVENHKHLGVTFSHNCKWHCHIENILKSTSSQLSMLRKFKFSLSRHNLEAIYFTYILPLLEYACELWDGCTQQEYNKIEQIQHEAARIITGLPKFSSLESLYFETGWEPLHSRRRRRKLNMFYKIRNNNAPSYLCDCLLPFERNENAYNLRNQTDYSNPFTRLQLYRNSFFPSSIKLWNNLTPEIRSARQLAVLKSH